MKPFFKSQFIVLLFSVLFSFSCSSDLDFNQTKNLRLEPAYVANLVYFDIPANEFVTNRIEMALRMTPGTALTESSTGTIKMRSGVTAYFVIQ